MSCEQNGYKNRFLLPFAIVTEYCRNKMKNLMAGALKYKIRRNKKKFLPGEDQLGD